MSLIELLVVLGATTSFKVRSLKFETEVLKLYSSSDLNKVISLLKDYLCCSVIHINYSFSEECLEIFIKEDCISDEEN